MEFQYRDSELMKRAWEALDRGESFKIIVKGWRSRILKKSLRMYAKYINERELRKERKRVVEIFRFAPFAMLTPAFWGIINHAMLNQMRVEHYEEGESLIVYFQKYSG